MKPKAYPVLAGLIVVRGLTQAEVAEAVGIAPNSVGHLLCGRQRPSPELRARFAAFLGVDEATLFQMHADVAQFIDVARAQGLGHLVHAGPGATAK